jgi:bacteriocin-like protein
MVVLCEVNAAELAQIEGGISFPATFNPGATSNIVTVA